MKCNVKKMSSKKYKFTRIVWELKKREGMNEMKPEGVDETRINPSWCWRVKWPEGMSEEPAYIHSSIQFIECDEVKATQHEFNLRLKKARRSSCRNSIYTSFRCVDAELKLIECRQWTKRAGAIPFQFHFHFIHAALMREMKRVKWNWRRERVGSFHSMKFIPLSSITLRELI